MGKGGVGWGVALSDYRNRPCLQSTRLQPFRLQLPDIFSMKTFLTNGLSAEWEPLPPSSNIHYKYVASFSR